MPTNDPHPTDRPTTLLEAINQLRASGFDGQLIATEAGTVRCTNCDTENEPETLELKGYYRLEGSSDAADMNLLTWADCPHCGKGGALTLGYGPNAGPADEAVLQNLALDDIASPGQTPTPPTSNK